MDIYGYFRIGRWENPWDTLRFTMACEFVQKAKPCVGICIDRDNLCIEDIDHPICALIVTYLRIKYLVSLQDPYIHSEWLNNCKNGSLNGFFSWGSQNAVKFGNVKCTIEKDIQFLGSNDLAKYRWFGAFLCQLTSSCWSPGEIFYLHSARNISM